MNGKKLLYGLEMGFLVLIWWIIYCKSRLLACDLLIRNLNAGPVALIISLLGLANLKTSDAKLISWSKPLQNFPTLYLHGSNSPSWALSMLPMNSFLNSFYASSSTSVGGTNGLDQLVMESGKKRGPFHQSELSAKSEILGSLVGISAGFISVGICFHWVGLLCVWISPTLFETNVFKLVDGEFIKCKQFVESVQNVMVLLSKSKAWATVNPSLVPRTHAANSRRLTDSVLVGATLAFAVISVTALQWFWFSPLAVTPLSRSLGSHISKILA